jgi:uncharacterized membrane protein YgcG
MPQNQEIIEAKLCAYIDDELDAAGRADIEKHLAANPQHRRLIEELRRTSALVHNLPHESAPPELAEAFNAQLERSVLLEGVSEAVAGADMKMRRWPQIMALAAITLLTVGLAVVVYFALPGIGNRPQLVQAVPRLGSASESAAVDQAQKLADASKALEFDKQATAQKTAVAEGATPPSGAVNGTSAPVALFPAAMPAPASGQMAFQRAEQQAKAGPVDRTASPIVLIVRSGNPGETRKALVTYLVQQNVPWEPAIAPIGVDALSGSPPATRPAVASDIQPPTSAQAPMDQYDSVLPPVSETSPPPPAPAQTRPIAPVANDIVMGNVVAAAPVAVNDFSVSCQMTADQVDALRTSIALAGASMDALPVQTRMMQPPPTANKDSSGQFGSGGAFSGGSGGGGGGGAFGGWGGARRFSPSAGPTTAPVASLAGRRAAGESNAATQPSAEGTLDDRLVPADDGRNKNRESLSTDAAAGSAGPTTMPTTPNNPAIAIAQAPLQLLIVVRPTEPPVADVPATQPAVPAAAEPPPPATEPAIPTTQE